MTHENNWRTSSFASKSEGVSEKTFATLMNKSLKPRGVAPTLYPRRRGDELRRDSSNTS
jgi:hypothetical protein